jgi:hypothetical protein
LAIAQSRRTLSLQRLVAAAIRTGQAIVATEIAVAAWRKYRLTSVA